MTERERRNMACQWLLLILWGFSVTYAQTNSCQEGSVRLVQTRSITLRNAGLVEVCRNGVWGTVCADSLTTPWSEKNAQVVCRQLGYSGALNSILQDSVNFGERLGSSTPIHYRSIRCSGEEDRLTDCPGISTATASCSHTQDVYIVCRPSSGRISPVHTASLRRGDIRLYADPDNGEGAVEFYHQSLGWSGICPDSNWGTSEAIVACRQLGYETGRAVTYTSNAIRQRFLRISDCDEQMDIGLHNCTVTTISSCFSPSDSYAGIQCSSDTITSAGSVRLLGDSRARGLVEVFYNGRWGPVCSTLWGSTEAGVACAELGFNRGDADRYTSSGAGIETNLKPIWLTNLDCSSTGTRLTRDCDYSAPIGYVNCPSSFAGVDCTPEPLSSGTIAGIVVGTLVFIGGLVGLWFGYGKERWQKRHTYPWYQNMKQWCSSCHCPRLPPPRSTPPHSTPPHSTPTRAPTVETATVPQETATTTNGRNSSSSSDSETEQPPERPDAEITKAAPPSYHASSNYPTGDPLKAPPTDLPPPYPGPPTAPPSAGYPPAGLGFSPLTPNYQGYPPPTNPTYPTAYPPGIVPSLELAYPPNVDTQQQEPPVDIITPYPVDTIPPGGADQQ